MYISTKSLKSGKTNELQCEQSKIIERNIAYIGKLHGSIKDNKVEILYRELSIFTLITKHGPYE